MSEYPSLFKRFYFQLLLSSTSFFYVTWLIFETLCPATKQELYSTVLTSDDILIAARFCEQYEDNDSHIK